MTCEEMHPVVGWGVQKLGEKYQTYGLGHRALKEGQIGGWLRRESKTGKGFEWVKDGTNLVMPEYKIAQGDAKSNFERAVVTDDAKDFVKESDKINY